MRTYNLASMGPKLLVLHEYERVLDMGRTRKAVGIIARTFVLLYLFTMLDTAILLLSTWLGNISYNLLWLFYYVNAGMISTKSHGVQSDHRANARDPTAVNMATSIVVIALAVPVVYSLRITKRRKIAAMAVFALGLLYVQPFHKGRSLVDHHPRVCALSGLQLWLQYAAYGSNDITYSDVPTVVCAALEANLTIIAACILALEPLIARLFPGFRAGSMDDAQSVSYTHLTLPTKRIV